MKKEDWMVIGAKVLVDGEPGIIHDMDIYGKDGQEWVLYFFVKTPSIKRIRQCHYSHIKNNFNNN